MKNECEIVQDLLINYYDDVLNTESKKLVEEHLKTCKKCKEKLEVIKKEPSDDKEQYIVNYMKKLRKKTTLKAISIAICLLVIIFLSSFLREVIIISNCLSKTEKLLEEDNIYMERISTFSDGEVSIYKNYYKDGKRKWIAGTYSDSGEKIIITQYDDANLDKQICINEDRRIYEEKEFTIDEKSLKNLIYIDENLNSLSNIIKMALECDIDVKYEKERYTSEKNKCYVLKYSDNVQHEREDWYDADTGLLIKEIRRYSVTNYFPSTNIIKEVVHKEDINRYSYSFDTVNDSDVVPSNLESYIKPVVIKTLKPSGFAGSSSYQVELYSNGDLSLVKFGGNGNLLSRGTISQNIDSIEMDGQGGIIATGKNVNTQYSSYPWLRLINNYE